MVSVMDYELTNNSQNKDSQQISPENCSLTSTATVITTPKSAVSQRSVELTILNNEEEEKEEDTTNITTDIQLATKPNLDLNVLQSHEDNTDQFNLNSNKSPTVSTIRHGGFIQQANLISHTDLVEDRKTLRDTLYQGIFHRHRRTIFALGSFLRMLKSRSSQYNSIRSSSEGEDIDESR